PEGTARLFAEGGFFTPDGKARMQPLAQPALAAAVSDTLPLLLNTGRVRDHWHTMTRTGLSPRLSAHIAEPSVLVHPDDALRFGLRDNGFARIASAHGAVVLKVALDPGAQPGSIFAPIHWSAETASDARIGAAVQPACDPFSGQPEMKATPASIAPVAFRSRGFLLSQQDFALPEGSWWARVTVEGGQGRLFATGADAAELMALVRAGFGEDGLVEMVDAERGLYRCAALRGGRLVAALFVGPDHDAPVWDAVKAAFARSEIEPRERLALLSGRSLDGAVDQGPTVCACFGVGLNAIRAAFAGGQALTPEDIGRQLKAGTNCGSCLPEIRRIGAQARATEAA
uniref:molybdopterin dinucleotide binding domain-containing protein n=1 Tax=Bosea sp. (in: a-proteobacteria) TaxID=1871050 RepID=UPI002FCB6EE7